jgi:hypothetical protein
MSSEFGEISLNSNDVGPPRFADYHYRISHGHAICEVQFAVVNSSFLE